MTDRIEGITRAEELLVRRATEGLSSAEQQELDELLAADPGADALDYELAAAAIQMAMTDIEPAPAHLRARLEALAARAGRGPVRRTRPTRFPVWLPVAAVLALVVVGWLALRPTPVPSPADQQQTLLAAGDAMDLPWTATDDPAAAGATGDVVWSTAEQAGFMRFSGLEPNDPSVFQYQLWIFDADRDERYPVDGGVFDVPAGVDEVVVPVHAKLEVHDPTLFAVTVERPGGVVVSARERIVVVAQR